MFAVWKVAEFVVKSSGHGIFPFLKVETTQFLQCNFMYLSASAQPDTSNSSLAVQMKRLDAS